MPNVLFSNFTIAQVRKFTFDAPATGPIIFTFYGSCYAPRASQPIGLIIHVDHEQTTSAGLYANQADVHMSMIPRIYEVTLNPSLSKHSIDFMPNANAVIDSNDRFTVTYDF